MATLQSEGPEGAARDRGPAASQRGAHARLRGRHRSDSDRSVHGAQAPRKRRHWGSSTRRTIPSSIAKSPSSSCALKAKKGMKRGAPDCVAKRRRSQSSRIPTWWQVYDVGEHNRQVFVPMEFIEGPNLRDWLESAPHRPRRILEVYIEAGRGLAAAHQAGIIHRDFKPENVLVGDDGRVRVLDFGLARGSGDKLEPSKMVEEDSSLSGSHALLTPLTREGAIMGTPAYMAPEQHLGLPSDERTDSVQLLHRAVRGPVRSASLCGPYARRRAGVGAGGRSVSAAPRPQGAGVDPADPASRPGRANPTAASGACGRCSRSSSVTRRSSCGGSLRGWSRWPSSLVCTPCGSDGRSSTRRTRPSSPRLVRKRRSFASPPNGGSKIEKTR